MKPKTILALLSVLFFFALQTPAGAVESGEIRYVNGTLNISQETVGKFETTAPDHLSFRSQTTEIRIPYAGITKVKAYRALARHLGVLPAIVVGMVRRRERKHFLSLTWTDAAGNVQVGLFEVPKDDPQALLPILIARCPQACGQDTCQEQTDEK